MDVGDVAAFLTRSLDRHLLSARIGTQVLTLILTLLVRPAKVRRGSLAERGVQPIVERHAGATRSSFGPLPHGWIDAVNTPRYARIHDSVRFRLRRPPGAFSLPTRSGCKDNRIMRGSSASKTDFCPLREIT